MAYNISFLQYPWQFLVSGLCWPYKTSLELFLLSSLKVSQFFLECSEKNYQQSHLDWACRDLGEIWGRSGAFNYRLNSFHQCRTIYFSYLFCVSLSNSCFSRNLSISTILSKFWHKVIMLPSQFF